jgi:U6 snRNA-associated Sm-like protein LSm1
LDCNVFKIPLGGGDSIVFIIFYLLSMADEFFGGVTSLADQLDKVVLLVLRDGKHLIGRLTSYDNFGSLVLENSSERKFAGGKYCDVEQGVFLVRGENITLIGEVDKEMEAAAKQSGLGLQLAELEEVQRLEEEEEAKRKADKGLTEQSWE